MTDVIVAFDIDGTLTEPEVKDVFKQFEGMEGVTVGIVTTNPPFMSVNFVSQEDLKPDFTQSALVKARALLGIGLTFMKDKKIYVGNSVRDKVFAQLAGWEFIHASDVENLPERVIDS